MANQVHRQVQAWLPLEGGAVRESWALFASLAESLPATGAGRSGHCRFATIRLCLASEMVVAAVIR